MEKKLTAVYLIDNFGGDINGAIKHCDEFRPKCPETPKKPYLQKTHTHIEAEQYAKDLKQYDNAMPAYRQQRELYQRENSEVNEQLELYLKDQSGFDRLVPEDKKSKVWGRAWEEGHSAGYYDVYLQLCNLVELFE